MLKRLGCLAHIRRRWYKAAEESCAEAIWFIGQIRQLYLIEDETRDLTRIFHKLSGFSRLARVPEEKLDWTALVFRFRQNLGLIPL